MLINYLLSLLLFGLFYSPVESAKPWRIVVAHPPDTKSHLTSMMPMPKRGHQVLFESTHPAEEEPQEAAAATQSLLAEIESEYQRLQLSKRQQQPMDEETAKSSSKNDVADEQQSESSGTILLPNRPTLTDAEKPEAPSNNADSEPPSPIPSPSYASQLPEQQPLYQIYLLQEQQRLTAEVLEPISEAVVIAEATINAVKSNAKEGGDRATDEQDSACPDTSGKSEEGGGSAGSAVATIVRRHSSSTTDSRRADSLPLRPLRRERLLGQSMYGSQRSLWCELPEVKESGLLERMDEEQKKLQEAYFEVITSEASYLRSISFLISHFMSAPELLAGHDTRLVITTTERKQLFSNIIAIRDCSERLLSELEVRLKEGLVLTDICDVLCAHFEAHFEPYVKYCSNQVYQDRTLKKLKDENTLSRTPMLAMPIFAEQNHNARMMAALNAGLLLCLMFCLQMPPICKRFFALLMLASLAMAIDPIIGEQLSKIGRICKLKVPKICDPSWRIEIEKVLEEAWDPAIIARAQQCLAQMQNRCGNEVPSVQPAKTPQMQQPQQQPIADHGWTYGPWGECSRSCGGGIRLRHAVCLDAAGRELNARMCVEGERKDSEKCNERLCPQWHFGPWSQCSVSCDQGVQRRKAQCVDSEGHPLEDNACNPREQILLERQCQLATCSRWQLGAWSQCSVSCGADGFQTRLVQCLDSAGNKLADEQCQKATGELRPQSYKVCNPGLCPHWESGVWSECSASCGVGWRRRSVYCKAANGSIVPPTTSACSEAEKPAVLEQCNAQPCSSTSQSPTIPQALSSNGNAPFYTFILAIFFGIPFGICGLFACIYIYDKSWSDHNGPGHPSYAVVRLKLLTVEMPKEQPPQGVQLTGLMCAAIVKEKVEINGKKRLIQNGKTIQLKWGKCFDIAIIRNRVLQVLVLREKNFIADATMRLEDIVSRCKGDSVTPIWINLKPCGRIFTQIQRIEPGSGELAPPTATAHCVLADEISAAAEVSSSLADLEMHFREQEQVLAQKDKGSDIVSVNRLLAKHTNAENNLAGLGRALDGLQGQGQQLMDGQIPGSGPVPMRLAETRAYYDHLKQLADERRRDLEGAVEYYQFLHDADDVDAYLLDTMRVVSTDDVGHDEQSVQALLKKHDGVSEELELFDRHIAQLEAQAQQLPDEVRAQPDIQQRLSGTQKRKYELVEISRMRKQRLIDSLSLHKLLADIDSMESWMVEKGKLLATLIPQPDFEEADMMKHFFETLQFDLANQAAKVQTKL